MNSNEKIHSSAPSDNPDSVAAKEEYLGNDKLTNPYAEEFQEFIQNQRDRISKSPDANERQYKKELRKNEKAYHDLIFDKTEYGKQAHAAEAKLEGYKKLLENRIQETPEARANRFEEYKKTIENRGEKTLDADQVQERFNNQNLLNTNKIREQIKAQEQIISNLHQDFEDSLAVASPEDEEALANWRKRQDELEAETRFGQQSSKDKPTQPEPEPRPFVSNRDAAKEFAKNHQTKDADKPTTVPVDSSINKSSHRTSEQDRGATIIKNEEDMLKRTRTKEYLDSDEGKEEQLLESKFDKISDRLDEMLKNNQITVEQRNARLDQTMEVFLNQVDKLRSGYEKKLKADRIARIAQIALLSKGIQPNAKSDNNNTAPNKDDNDNGNKDDNKDKNPTPSNATDNKNSNPDDKSNKPDDKKFDREAAQKELAELKKRKSELENKMEERGGIKKVLEMVHKFRKEMKIATDDLIGRNITREEVKKLNKRSFRDYLYEQYDWMDHSMSKILTSNKEYRGKKDDEKFSIVWNALTEEQRNDIRRMQSLWVDPNNKRGQAFRQWLKNNSLI